MPHVVASTYNNLFFYLETKIETGVGIFQSRLNPPCRQIELMIFVLDGKGGERLLGSKLAPNNCANKLTALQPEHHLRNMHLNGRHFRLEPVI